MKNTNNARITSKHSTLEQNEDVLLRQPNSEVNVDLMPNDKIRRQLKELGLHAVQTFVIAGLGTFFYFLHAPSEVIVLIILRDVIYIWQLDNKR